MEQFNIFNAEKTALIDKLSSLKKLVTKLDGVGIDVSDDLNKIQDTIQNVEGDLLRIALVGAFSDGKTSVIAGWLGQVLDNMKIDTDESSDALAIYQPENLPEKCEIIDTPGLFGDKEKTDEAGNVIQYADVTKKYLSEANLIFYVVDATNPMKDSHESTVKWLLRDLNKLSSTIFIINKMDEVSDLRDHEDFENQSQIKKKNLIGKLEKFVSLSEDEKNSLNIVCLSSNPNGRGLDFWLNEKPEIYSDRSRMNVLQNVTQEILDKNTANALIAKTGMDVINDVVSQKIMLAEEQFNEIHLYAENVQTNIQRIEQDIINGRKQVIAAKNELTETLIEREKNLLGKIRTLATNEEYLAFLEDEIGHSESDFGYKLKLRIENACQNCFQQTTQVMNGISTTINEQINMSESLVNTLSNSALKGTSQVLSALSKTPVSTIKSGVFFARDTIASVTGVVFKFKPWGATKLAAGVSKWAGPIGAGVQLFTSGWELYQQNEKEEKIKKMQSDLSEMVKEHFKAVYDVLRDDEKTFEAFAPQLAGFMAIIEQQRQELLDLERKHELLLSVKNEFQSNLIPQSSELR
ncbi:LeoA/HP0731 family dynamin-like GTPase [Terasakiella pusilla]|uniref:LeoA/HP0731 family dynamin-like GTPase n=1 Tax=Terasakiella pusilla TaxID=64973 RepID=UPI00048D8E58|nr:LeoA/HP0731 family dynamin-like GTPase [Terasakiella pusilla]